MRIGATQQSDTELHFDTRRTDQQKPPRPMSTEIGSPTRRVKS
jgi:hypothetical protein